MWSIIRENPKAVLFAIVVHVVFVGVLIFSFRISTPTVAVNPEVKIVKATVIDEGKIKEERKRKEAIKRKKEQARKEAERKKREAELKKQREAEKKRLALKKKKEVEAKKRKAELARKKKEQERKAAELKKQQEEADRKAREAELQRQLAEDERQRKLQAQRAAQQKEVDRYQALIKQAISNKWRIPVSARQGQECVLKLRLIPSGEVVSVQVIKSSGDNVFDRSVESAVYKASPLPLPPAESGLFNEFREINVPFRLEKKT